LRRPKLSTRKFSAWKKKKKKKKNKKKRRRKKKKLTSESGFYPVPPSVRD